MSFDHLPIAVFAYAFPHRKTQDFLYELAAAGHKNVCVLAAPWKPLAYSDKSNYFPRTIRPPAPYGTQDLCRSFGFEYHEVDHADVLAIAPLIRNRGIEIGVIAGARILKRQVIDLFAEGVVNFHPGKIPETSGLDALFYSIRRNVPMGMTVHLIDHRVDAGRFIFFEELQLGPDDGLDAIAENMHLVQVTALRRFLSVLRNGKIEAEPIDRPAKNTPMPEDEKWRTLSLFPRWRAYHFIRQQTNKLFEACRLGEVASAVAILDSFPDLISARTPEQWTPLIVACFHGSAQVVELLLQRGADPNAPGRNGTTPLMYAKTRVLESRAGEADYTVLDLLVRYGADTSRTDCYGRTIFDYIETCGNSQLVARLEQLSGADPRSRKQY